MYRDHRPRTPRTPRTRKTTVRMDPDCAICHAPASMACDCEAKGLDVAIKQAEQRMMQSIYNDIRSWVRAHAQDYILEYFRLLTERRKASHAANLDRINATAYHYYHAPPHPSELAQAQADLKRGIDEDWQSSVQRYPEVLEYFFSLVDLTVPPDDDPIVKDPPLSALSGSRKSSGRRLAGGGPQPPGRPQAITAPVDMTEIHSQGEHHLPSNRLAEWIGEPQVWEVETGDPCHPWDIQVHPRALLDERHLQHLRDTTHGVLEGS
ncbi:serine threonine protein phosphatase [Colletotrichum tofieldiae]|nr:serine threonine protein phosphatase [Colletotrichum tofieldiae]